MAFGRPLSEHDDAVISEMWASHTLAEIGAEVDRNTCVVLKAGRRLGLPSRRDMQSYDKAVREGAVMEMTANGMNGAAIARALGVSDVYVCKVRQALEIAPGRDRVQRYRDLETMLLAGQTQAQASRALGIDQRTISKMVLKLGLPRRATRGRPQATSTNANAGGSR